MLFFHNDSLCFFFFVSIQVLCGQADNEECSTFISTEQFLYLHEFASGRQGVKGMPFCIYC